MVKASALLLLLFFSDTVNLTVTVSPDTTVSATPPAATPGSNAIPAAMGGALAASPAIVLWPKGHRLSACTPNLEPRLSAWRDMLEENQGRLCTTTKVPA